jgi:uncharacterized protein (TIGR03084 family)
MPDLPGLLADLDAEYDELHRLVAPWPADAPEWDRATPAEGWAIRDQVGHLAFFDEAGHQALVDPDGFTRAAQQAVAAGDPMQAHLVRGRSIDGTELRSWWEGAHAGMMQALAAADPTARIPWYGPPMGLPSFATARLMETWAHGQDIVDALGVQRDPTDRLRHIAHLGIRARPFSYLVRERQMPTGRIDVVLAGPSGDEWRWEVGSSEPGVPTARIEGPALDFCWVVTRRRHPSDTDLLVVGEDAREWMSLAQAFAGPPGSDRPPLRE